MRSAPRFWFWSHHIQADQVASRDMPGMRLRRLANEAHPHLDRAVYTDLAADEVSVAEPRRDPPHAGSPRRHAHWARDYHEGPPAGGSL